MSVRSHGLVLALAVVAAAAGGYLAKRDKPVVVPEPAAAPHVIGRSVADIRLPDLDGKMHALGDYHGRRMVVNFWASWCRPCLEEIPALVDAQRKFGENRPIVLGIAMDEPDHVRAFLAAHPVNYPILLGDMKAPSTTRKLGNERELLPYSVLIDADGSILATHAGVLAPALLERWTQAGSPP